MNSTKDGITHQGSSVSPPWRAMADLTLLANWTASSSSFKGHKFNIIKAERSQLKQIFITFFYLLPHQTSSQPIPYHANITIWCSHAIISNFSPRVLKLGENFASTTLNIPIITIVNSTGFTAILCIFDALLMVPSCTRKSWVQSYISQHWQQFSIKLIWRQG